jgi:hypothetical protein
MLRPKPALKPKQMLSESQNNHVNPLMETAMQRMVEVCTEMMQVVTQNLINQDSKELSLGMQQVLDDHSRITQIRS